MHERESAGPVEQLLRKAAARQQSRRSLGELAVDGNGMMVHPSHSAARRWSVLGALMAERGYKFVPSQETLQRELGKPIELLIDAVPGIRGLVDWKRYTVVDVLSVLGSWCTDEALNGWWQRAADAAREQGL